MTHDASARSVDDEDDFEEFTFRARLQSDSDNAGAWTVVVWPGSYELLGSRMPVKVAGTVDDMPVSTSVLPFGDGAHMLPLRADVRRRLAARGTHLGDEVAVRLHRR
ncbi:DUF1905 domain-containing protein [Schumannella sp. 10F1B-5-1]|uniref:DUF1905 domain-containing protein n=1 Tax=Schumannella sp. 10F1B-5-1 TaxID=2590780 RepID=UPI0011322F52|nr:DUF1905 domain-containing protein [Schumannella sp. 10F1B-5-1]TPW73535.1 DUF1905 domain-containing protein [Schumannella sp. 10F1B-5-1]